MDLIDREALFKSMNILFDKEHFQNWSNTAWQIVQDQPTIEAVPLDALCEWLSEKCRMTIGGVHCRFPKDTWKQILNEWMEGQHDHN